MNCPVCKQPMKYNAQAEWHKCENKDCKYDYITDELAAASSWRPGELEGDMGPYAPEDK